MAKTWAEYHEELSNTFDKLEWFEGVEDRLWYYDTEKQITDDLLKIKDTVLNIYWEDKRIDRTLIKPLIIKLNRLWTLLDYFEKSEKNKQLARNSSIREMRTLVYEISNLKTNDRSKLKDSFSKDWFNQIWSETMNLINSQYSRVTEAISNLWNNSTDNYLEEVEKERKKFISEFCSECENYIIKNKGIIDNLDTKEDRLKFALELIAYVFEIWISPSKYKLVLWRKFDILDDIEEYGWELYSLLSENKQEIKDFIKDYV